MTYSTFLEALRRSPILFSLLTVAALVFLLRWRLNRPKRLSLPVANVKHGNWEEAIKNITAEVSLSPCLKPHNPLRSFILP